MMRHLIPILLLAGCAHQPEIILQPVACITEKVHRDPKHVTDAQLKRIDAKKSPEKYITLATARIHQDAGYIGQIESQVETCSKIPSTQVPEVPK